MISYLDYFRINRGDTLDKDVWLMFTVHEPLDIKSLMRIIL